MEVKIEKHIICVEKTPPSELTVCIPEKRSICVSIERADNGSTPIDIDDTVTEDSPNPVRASGIWAWVKNLLKKENIGGLTNNDSPTFADATIPALANPTSYDPATVAYLTELFGGLSDSVKENILRGWGRLAEVENNLIADITTINRITEFEISKDINDKDLDETGISIITRGVNYESGVNTPIVVNDITTPVYWNSKSVVETSFVTFSTGETNEPFTEHIIMRRVGNYIVMHMNVGRILIGGGRQSFTRSGFVLINNNIKKITIYNLRMEIGSNINIYRL